MPYRVKQHYWDGRRITREGTILSEPPPGYEEFVEEVTLEEIEPEVPLPVEEAEEPKPAPWRKPRPTEPEQEEPPPERERYRKPLPKIRPVQTYSHARAEGVIERQPPPVRKFGKKEGN
jgi:hypothetical protein